MLFINTRPAERASLLSARLEQAGFELCNLPLLSLSPIAFDNAIFQQFQQLHTVQAIVVVSPTAVEIGMRYLTQSGLSLDDFKGKDWIAVGQGTAAALAAYDIQAHVPKIETSEGMLSLDLFTQTSGMQQIAFWRGIGGRQFMMNQCQQRQIEVLNIVLYERALPLESKQIFQNFYQQQMQCLEPFWICITSEASWHYWLELNQENKTVLQLGRYLVLGPRLFNILHQYRAEYIFDFQLIQISHLDADTILQAISENTEFTQRSL